MPKQLKNIRENILQEAKAQLLRDGMDALTMRSVANACQIAVGTLYNYFSSKDMLIAAAMLEDWLVSLQSMRDKADAAESVEEGLRCIYDEIIRFREIYSVAWANYGGQDKDTLSQYYVRHNQLVGQLNGMIHSLTDRLTGPVEDCYCRACGELLLQQAASAGREDFDALAPVLHKLLF